MPLVADPQRGTTIESQSLYNLAIEKIKRNQYREALVHLSEAIRIAPGNPYYRSYFGYCLAQSEGEFERALRFCRNACNSRPMDPELHINLGRIYKLVGDNASAYKAFVDAWKVCKGHPMAAAELTRMGVRRPPVLPFLSRSNWCNKYLGMVRATFERRISAI